MPVHCFWKHRAAYPIINSDAPELLNKEIADKIGVSESSSKATLQQLFAKTGVGSRSQLVRIALERYRDQL